jgi:hypothetical protein
MKDLIELIELLTVVIGIPFALFVLLPFGVFWLIAKLVGL